MLQTLVSTGSAMSLPSAMTAATMPSIRSVLFFLLGLRLPAAGSSIAVWNSVRSRRPDYFGRRDVGPRTPGLDYDARQIERERIAWEGGRCDDLQVSNLKAWPHSFRRKRYHNGLKSQR